MKTTIDTTILQQNHPELTSLQSTAAPELTKQGPDGSGSLFVADSPAIVIGPERVGPSYCYDTAGTARLLIP